MSKKLRKLPTKLDKRFRVIKGHPWRFLHRHYGSVNLETITPDRAEQLANDGVALKRKGNRKQVG